MALYDIGDQVELTIYVTTDAGTASAATTVTCTITLPDGTTTSPTVTTPATGTYTFADFLASQAGTHYVKWTVTGIGSVSGENDIFEDSFTVSEATNTYVGLDEAKSFLNLQTTTDDDELLAYLEWACDLAQQVADTQFARKTVTDVLSPRGDETFVQLSHRPVISITSATERGTTLTANTQYTTDLRWGRLYRMAGTYDRGTWASGTRSTTVVYVAGYAIIPTPVRNATLQILDHLWSNQRNPGGARPSRGQDYPQAGANWNIPNRARDILLDYRPPQVG